MKVKYLKIACAILFTLLATIYLTSFVISLWMLYMLSFPHRGSNETASDRTKLFLMFGIILFVSLICSISTILLLIKEDIKLIYALPAYLFLPISIPYLLIKKSLKNNNQAFEIYGDGFSQFLLAITSFANYLTALSPLFMGIILILSSSVDLWILFISIPVTLIAILMITGTTANIINYRTGSKLTNKISYLGFTFVWVYKIYKISLLKNDIYEIKN